MKRETVVKAFREVKKVAKLDYSLSTAKCCGSCMNYDLVTKYGNDSKGIFLKYYTSGSNRDSWHEDFSYYINHDLTDEQKDKVVEVLKKYFKVEWSGSNYDCIKISDY